MSDMSHPCDCDYDAHFDLHRVGCRSLKPDPNARKPDAMGPAQDRLNRIALRVGRLLIAGVQDPDWDDQQELEAASVEYAKAMGGQDAR